MISNLRISRVFSAAAVLLLFKSASLGLPDGHPPGPPAQPATQACNGGSASYDCGAGSASGTGNSSARARSNAGSNAGHELELSYPACSNCSSGSECPSTASNNWTNWACSTPVQDPVTGLWSATVSWDACTVTQTCNSCPP